jgi:hypothetical protein
MMNATSERYIISLNEKLQEENKNLNRDNVSNLDKIQNLEEEIDKLESSKTYMRGFLNNIIIMQKLHMKKNDIYIDINKTYNHNSKTVYKKNKKMFRLIQIFLVILLAIIYNMKLYSIYEYIFLISLYTGFHMFSINLITDTKLSNMDSQYVLLENIDKEILELNKGQDFLHEYVEIM